MLADKMCFANNLTGDFLIFSEGEPAAPQNMLRLPQSGRNRGPNPPPLGT
jgi:hypothetical protein